MTQSGLEMWRPPPLLAALAAATLVAAADPVPVTITTDSSGPSTRVVLMVEKGARCKVVQETARVQVECDNPIAPTPRSGALDDTILTRFALEGDRTIVFATGPGFRRLDTFELRNPTRLVIDAQGERGAAPARAAAPAKAQPVVVIDPGHGGVETGAVGPTGVQEKDVTLDLARRLKALLERRGLTAVLTRDEDRVLPLDDRTSVANHNRAVLFLSIHLNASKRKDAAGAETYFLSTGATDAEARTLAALENKAYDPGGASSEAKAAAPPDRGLELVLWDLAQNSYLAESSRLAESVQAELNALTGARDRGVRQAPFRVLMGATMPAILVEAGFISNPEEEARLKDAAYKDKVAEAIAAAVASFAARS